MPSILQIFDISLKIPFKLVNIAIYVYIDYINNHKNQNMHKNMFNKLIIGL